MRTSIQWNPKGQSLISPIERDRFEQGEPPRRLDGEISIDGSGRIWLMRETHKKLVGQCTDVTPDVDEPDADRRAWDDSEGSDEESEPEE